MSDHTTAQVRAIPTNYHGCRFRSRLEARWAVFFDALGIRWEFEPEGFELEGAGWYLPDFYLPDEDAYVEVKPLLAGNCPAWGKPASLAAQKKVRVVVVVGQPEFGWRERRDFMFDGSDLVVWFLGKPWPMPTLHAAAEKATKARFEFGECG